MAVATEGNRPQKSLDGLSMEEILLTASVQEETITDLMYIIPRILSRYLSAYSIFQESTVYYIPVREGKRKICIHFLNRVLLAIVIRKQKPHNHKKSARDLRFCGLMPE